MKKTLTLRTLLSIIFILALIQSATGNRTLELRKLRKDCFKLYSSGEYDKAYPILREILQKDSSASDWMDYFLLADIYIRREMKDSVNWILTLGEKRTAKSSDARLVKRNNEVWTNLREQLKNQRSDFKVPPFRKLEDYEEKPLPDSTKIIAFKDSIKVSSSPDTITASKDRPPISLVPGLRERRFNPTGIPQPILVGGNQALQEYIETQGLFPDSAKQANIDRGLVMVEVTVDTSGNAIDFKIIDAQPENMGFEELALQALRAMKYEPTVLEGVKVEGVLRQPVVFSNQED